jgi:L-cysteine S-thiosulfotransferase
MNVIKKLLTASAISGLLAVSGFASDTDLVIQGEKIFNTNTQGNCLACHAVN